MHWREYQSLQDVAEVGDRFVSYVDRGQGEPVILLHGIPTWGYMWYQMLEPLSKSRRVLIPDLIGFGYSDKRDCFDRSIAAQCDMICEWMDAIGLERATIVAHDIGGGVALRMATLHPQRVSRLSLMNAICYDSWPIELMLQLGHPSAAHKLSAAATVTMLRQALKGGFASTPGDELLDGLLAPYSTEVGKVSLVRNAAALNTNLTAEITHLLPRIDAETLILWGEEDRFQLVEYGERLAADIPSAKLVRIADARHFVMLDRPQEVLEQLQGFLS